MLQGHQVSSALHLFGVAKSNTSFGWGKGGKVTAAGWQVTLCDPIWHVISVAVQMVLHKLLYLLYFLRGLPTLHTLLLALFTPPHSTAIQG